MVPPRVRWALASCLLGLLLHSPPATAQGPPYPARPGEVIIKFSSHASASEQEAILADLGAVDVGELPGIAAKRARVAALSVEDAVRRYRGHPQVEFIEPNYIYRALAVPNDPRFAELWALENNGQTGGTPGADIRATLAWDITTGSADVRVAITDTGMDYFHPDLATNAFINPGEIAGNGLDDDGNGFVDDVRGWDFANNDNDPFDDHGHGTHVSGSVGALGNNGSGVVGVSWHVRILPLKFLDATGAGTTDAAVRAIDYAVAMGARVINASWGGGAPSEALRLAIQRAGEAGAVFVASAGNAGRDIDVFPTFPASYNLPHVIAVAATNHDDVLPFWSNYGAVSVHLAAPGENILSTLPGGYGVLSGTSMAAPHVSGALALIFARFPAITAVDAKTLLLDRVDPLPSLAGRVRSGGRLNALLPLAQPDEIPPGPVTDLAASDPDGTRITLRWTATGDDGASGTAARYEIRYSTSPIDEGSFGTATPAAFPPRPRAVGGAEEFQVTGLAFATTYYVALKALDELGNTSPLSNPASATTLGPPDIGVSPTALSADLVTGQRASQVLTLSNTGEGELRFEIGVRVTSAAPADATAAVRVRTIAIPQGGAAGGLPRGASRELAATGVGTDEAPGSGDPLPSVSYSQGRSAPRPALGPGEVRITNALPGPLRVLLLQSGAAVSEIRSLLSSFPDLEVVDVFDGSSRVPTLAQLVTYHSVIVVDNTPFGDPDAIGDVLADYVDAGGGVVLTIASFIATWEVRGRFLSGSYPPFTVGSGPIGGAGLGSFDATHPIMAGVTSASGDLLADVSVAGGAELIASWNNSEPFVATKGRVAAVNIFVGVPGFWTGDIPLLLHNAAFWSASSVWLGADPTAGIVPAGAQVGVVVTFDAAELDGGDYTAIVRVTSDDPDEGLVQVPAHLHVTGRPDIVVSGDPVVLESVQSYARDGARTTHRLTPALPPGGGGVLELVAEGNYGNPGEMATATAEGGLVGSVGEIGIDCAPARGRFALDAARLAGLMADGTVDVEVQNALSVGVFCATNRHTVKLAYGGPADRLDFGPVFIGLSRELAVLVQNAGSDVLTVSSVTSDASAFSPDASAFTLLPRTSQRLLVRFLPGAALVYTGTLALRSDDPDEPQLEVLLRGEGLPPPDISVAPAQVDAGLLTGEVTTRTLSLRNEGGSDLGFTVRTEPPPDVRSVAGRGAVDGASPFSDAGALSAARPPEPRDSTRARSWTAGALAELQEGPPRSDRAPAGYRAQALAASVMSGATVLLVEDVPPWGTMTNEALLRANGIAFDVIATGALDATDLARYRKVIVAGDQPTGAYSRLAAAEGQLRQYVESGGVLEFHAAAWGFLGGDASLVTLPGGMRIHLAFAGENDVLDPGHPLVAGVPDPFTGTLASHAYFSSIPAGAAAVVADLQGRVNLVVYSLGRGLVIAGGQTLEFGAAVGQGAGIILRNMVPYGLRRLPDWLRASPDTGRVAVGGTVGVALRFDAAGLPGGDYDAAVVVESNDPDDGEVRVPVRLHVTGAPDIAVAGVEVAVESVQQFQIAGAVTQHHLAATVPAGGGGALELEARGDYENFSESATVTVEGLRLGAVGPTGLDCAPAWGQFEIGAADLARLVVDGVVDAEVQNASVVDPICPVNSHRVRLSYRGPESPLEFGALFVGQCRSLGVEVANLGTAELHVGPLAAPGFQVSPAAGFSLAPGQRQPVAVTWCPAAAGPVAATLAIHGDDPDEPELQVLLRGEGFLPPDIAVAPRQLEENSLAGQRTEQRLLIANAGGWPLEVRLEVRPGATTGAAAAVPPASARAAPPTGMVADERTNAPTSGSGGDVRVVSDSPGWIQATPTEGTVQPQDVLEVTVAFDASGLAPGDYQAQLLVKSNDPGEPELTVPIRLVVAGVPADLDVDPDTINLGRRGRWLTCFLEFPAGLDPASVDLASLRFNGQLAAEPTASVIGDHDGDGVLDLQVKFDFEAARPTLAMGAQVRTIVTGLIGGTTRFLGVDMRHVIGPQLLAPNGGAPVPAGGEVEIRWGNPESPPPDDPRGEVHDAPAPDHSDLHVSRDGGVTWAPIAAGVQGTAYRWHVPAVGTCHARVRVDVYDAQGLLASDASDGEFEIQVVTTAVGEASPPTFERALSNAPNPFSTVGGTIVRFVLPAPGMADLGIFSVSGRRVRVLKSGWLAAGRHEVRWDGCGENGARLGPGLYFCRLRSPGLATTTRMMALP